MAKVGEGDKRWIVKDRGDGKNVNNWHWSEKDVSAWAHARLAELLKSITLAGVTPTGAPVTVSVHAVDPVEGDATLYNRKGQLRTLHDLKVSAKWKGTVAADDAKGTLKFELYDDAPDVTFLADTTTPAAAACRQILKADGAHRIARIAQLFVDELQRGGNALDPNETLPHHAHQENTIHHNIHTAPKQNPVALSATTPTPKQAHPQNPSPPATDAKHTLRITEQFKCSPLELFRSLVDPERVSGYTMKPAEISQEPGGTFSIAAGRVVGKQVKLVPGKLIHQKWRMSCYPEGLMTDVTITIHDKDGQVVLELVQKGIPQSLMHPTENEWRMETFQRMKLVLGYGSARFF